MKQATAAIFFIVAALLFWPAIAARAYEGYPNPDELAAEIQALKDARPDLVEIGEYGKSIEGRPLVFIRIARPGGAERPEALVAAGIHGNEWIGNRVAMGVAKRLVEGADGDPWIASLLDRFDIFIIPSINPDGYAKTWELRDDENARWTHMWKNAAGVDINRNFPLPAERTLNVEMAGSDDPNDARYMGPHSYSEPESRAIRDFVAGRRFFASIDLHSDWAMFFPPKCNGPACEKRFRAMMEAAQEKQPYVKYQIVQHWQADSFSGEMEDALFYDFGILAVCWEVFPLGEAHRQQEDPRYKHPFWSMNPVHVGHWLENDVDALLAALEKAFEITKGQPAPEKARKPK